jgi:hypothetical protein
MAATKASGTALGALPLATGGVATAPTLALIGEGRYSEAVIPLDGPVFDRFFAPLAGEEGGGTVYASQNLYGDINTGSDEESLFASFNSHLINALRSA